MSTKSNVSVDYQNTPLESISSIHNDVYGIHGSRRLHTYEYRMHQLKKLGYVIQDNQDAICESVTKDLGRRKEETLVLEVAALINEIELAVKRLAEWMADESVKRDTQWMYKMNNPAVRKQPKGPGLIISPWNFPFLLALGPLIGAIAAGCPAVIKPSEHSPHSSALIKQLVESGLDGEAYKVVLGEVEASSKLLELKWGHIFFTGAPTIGKVVAAAAAKNLVPCTLELGGKSPVIIAPCANLKITARRVLSLKAYGAGQMCVNGDYVLCPEHLVERFMREIEVALKEFYPPGGPNDPSTTADLSSMISQRGFARALGFLESIKSAGRTVLGGVVNPEIKRISTAVVLLNKDGEGENTPLVTEEIFAPILPVIPVKDIDAAIEYVNAREHPLALYVFSSKRSEYDYAAGSAWNDVGVQWAMRALPAGGVGNSGYGSGHGKQFFDAFTHRRAMVDVPYNIEPIMSLRYPPFTPRKSAWWLWINVQRLSFSRSASPGAERRAWLGAWRAVGRKLAGLVGVLAVVLGWRGRRKIEL